MFPQHRLLLKRARSCSTVRHCFKMSSSVGQDEIPQMRNGATTSVSMPSPKPQQDRTWKSIHGISFADADVGAQSPLNGVRLHPGPSLKEHGRDGATKLCNSIRQETPGSSSLAAVHLALSDHISFLRRDAVLSGPLVSPMSDSRNLPQDDTAIPRPVEEFRQGLESRPLKPSLFKADALSAVAHRKASLITPGTEPDATCIFEDQDRYGSPSGIPEHSSPGRLNFEPSQHLAYPGLSTSTCLTERESFYPVPDVTQCTSGVENRRTNGDSRTALEDSTGSRPLEEDAPFQTPLGFHIPKAKLQEARDAEPTSVGAYWQYTLYQGPGGDKDKVKVHYCKSKEATERICQLFVDEKVIGFDIEWKINASATDGIKKNVALAQVASEERIALFHIARYPNATTMDDFVAPTFKKIMESPSITKVGVSVKGDCTRLRRFMNIESRGIFELSHLYKLVKFSSGDVKKINKVLVNLAQQVQEHLQLPLWKGEVRSSDWSQDLNYQQIQYAASDSYAGFQLYHILESKRKALDLTPPRPAHAELNLPIRLANGQTVAAYDEAPENLEESSTDAGLDLTISIEELARDFLNLKFEDLSATPEQCTGRKSYKPSQFPKPFSTSSVPASSDSSSSSATPTPNKPLHPDVIKANSWVTSYMNSLPSDRNVVAKPAELRAYHLWCHQELEINHIASRLRDPPLVTGTVAGYILRAIQVEHLPFPKRSVWALIPEVHISLRNVYKAMIAQRLKNGEDRADGEGTGNEALKDSGSGEESCGGSTKPEL